MLLFKLISLFEKEEILYAVSGGYALCLNGAVRPTHDIDFVLSEKWFNEDHFNFLKSLLQSIDYNYSPENSSSNLKLFNKKDCPDILFHKHIEFEKFKLLSTQVKSHKIEYLSPKDLIEIKQKNFSDQNKEDIKALRFICE